MSETDPSRAVPRTRVALAGFGAWGQMHARAIAAIDGAEVVAVLAGSEASRRAAAELVPQARLAGTLEALLALMAEEAAPELPPWFVAVDTLALQLTTTPSRDALIAALRARGYVACACHVERRALRTNATTAQVLDVAVADCGYARRRGGVPDALLRRHEDTAG